MFAPQMDDKCSKYLTYRDLIEVGETFNTSNLTNEPVQWSSYMALRDISTFLLDPIIDKFGRIDITYGFCSHGLSRKIPGRIAPQLDQHSAFENNSLGHRICKRDGAAVDFFVPKYRENMQIVADWIIENLAFDRLYFYGENRPIHLSYSDIPSKKATAFSLGKSGRRIPKVYVSRGEK